MVQLRHFMTVGAACGCRVETPLQRARERRLPISDQMDLTLPNPAERIIDAVDAGAGHNAQNKAFFHFRSEQAKAGTPPNESALYPCLRQRPGRVQGTVTAEVTRR